MAEDALARNEDSRLSVVSPELFEARVVLLGRDGNPFFATADDVVEAKLAVWELEKDIGGVNVDSNNISVPTVVNFCANMIVLIDPKTGIETRRYQGLGSVKYASLKEIPTDPMNEEGEISQIQESRKKVEMRVKQAVDLRQPAGDCLIPELAEGAGGAVWGINPDEMGGVIPTGARFPPLPKSGK
jgi:hypothetical protein